MYIYVYVVPALRGHSLPTSADLGPGLGLGKLPYFFLLVVMGERYPKTPLIALVGDSGADAAR